ncbi:hypothetical protein WA026_019593 [Henosepilachna vigintioctopunctata]|uniref:Uncharacterized protein n=1 Tax=Henosepilachna vigintioctopunctata TaxID=420089 RepID=A0AAW1TPQ5_9CUCU
MISFYDSDEKNSSAECLRSKHSRKIVKFLVKLERVLGVTVNSNVALDSNNNGSVAYPAGMQCHMIKYGMWKIEQKDGDGIERDPYMYIRYLGIKYRADGKRIGMNHSSRNEVRNYQ